MDVRAVVMNPTTMPFKIKPTRNQTIETLRASFDRGDKSPYLKHFFIKFSTAYYPKTNYTIFVKLYLLKKFVQKIVKWST